MKKIIFVRHGRAEDTADDFNDFERSLTMKGKKISRQVAARLKESISSPGVIITSPAFRALETAIIFAGEFKIDPGKIIINSNLYYRMSLRLLPEILSFVDETTESIMLFGHNPAFTEMADNLSTEGSEFLPKSGVAVISFNVMTWSEIKSNTGKLELFMKP